MKTSTFNNALSIIYNTINERQILGFPLLTDELIAEVAEINNLDAETLSDYYYGFN